ncbi:hypothetical protein ABMA46_10210 [Mesorhizobium sp. CN5-321]|uniref:hypothetical protein n=1 Tax=Mesorhizobium hunchu TaxID=3157708 RepID=UPI0032B71A4B
MDWGGLIRAISERALFYAVLGAVFFGLAIGARRMGIDLATPVLPWLNLAFLACVSLIIVEGGRQIIAAVKSKRSERQYKEMEEQDALRNIASLYPEEAAVLKSLLSKQAPRRFQVHTLSTGNALLQKGVLVAVRSVGVSGDICEVHPAIYARRDQIAPQLPDKKDGAV